MCCIKCLDHISLRNSKGCVSVSTLQFNTCLKGIMMRLRIAYTAPRYVASLHHVDKTYVKYRYLHLLAILVASHGLPPFLLQDGARMVSFRCRSHYTTVEGKSMCDRKSKALTLSRGTQPIPPYLLSKYYPLHCYTLAVPGSTNSRPLKSTSVLPIVLPYAPRSTNHSIMINRPRNAPAHRPRQARKNINISTMQSTCSTSPTCSSARKAPVLPPCTSLDFGEFAVPLPTQSLYHSAEPPTADPQSSHSLSLNSESTKDTTHLSYQSDISVWADPPSPMAAKSRQHSKLRRFLGESVPAELVYGKQGDLTCVVDAQKRVSEEFKDYTYWKVAPGPNEDENNGLQDIDEEGIDDEGKALELRWGATETVRFRCPTSKRYTQRFSGKWVEERSGRRWVADDYHAVLDALRKL